MRELINKVTEYRDILSEGKVLHDVLDKKGMGLGICNWVSKLEDNEELLVVNILKRVKYEGPYICMLPYDYPYRGQEKRIEALNFIIKELEKMDKPWYWKIFLRKGYLDLTK